MSKTNGWFMSFRRGFGLSFDGEEELLLGPWLMRLRCSTVSVCLFKTRRGWRGGEEGCLIEREREDEREKCRLPTLSVAKE